MVYGFRVSLESNWSVPNLDRLYDLFEIPEDRRAFHYVNSGGHKLAMYIVARFFDLELFSIGDGRDDLGVVVGIKLVSTADRAVEFDVSSLVVNPYSQRAQNLRMMTSKLGRTGNPGYLLVPFDG